MWFCAVSLHARLQLWVHLRELNELNRISGTPILLFCPYTFLLKVSSLIHKKHGSFCFCPAMNVSHKIFPLFCVLFFWMTILGQAAFHRSLGTFFLYHAVWKYCNWTLAVQKNVFLTSINHPLWLKTLDCVPLLYPSSDEVMARCVESIVLASILFSYASGHNKDFSVVHIQQSTSIQSIISW